MASLAQGALNKTYPTSPVTTIRVDAYQDGFNTIYNSSWTVQVATWVPLISTYTWINPKQSVTGWTGEFVGSTWTVKQASWTLQNYTDMIVNTTKLKMINNILDDDLEEYFVWPSSTCPEGWQGWASSITTQGKIFAVPCP